MYYIDYKDWFKQNIEEFNDYFAPEFAFKNIKIAYAIASATLTYYTNKIVKFVYGQDFLKKNRMI